MVDALRRALEFSTHLVNRLKASILNALLHPGIVGLLQLLRA
jgi:hypothetical protein